MKRHEKAVLRAAARCGLLAIAVLVPPDAGAMPSSASSCSDCHEGAGIADHARAPKIAPAVLKSSVHSSVGCGQCHAGFGDFPHPRRGPDCAGCHAGETAQYAAGAHGKAAASGDTSAPDCAACHGGHDVRMSDDPASRAFKTARPALCGRCHDDERLSRDHGIPGGRLRTFEQSFHGISLKYGEKFAADCSSCHGSHAVLPASDPSSSIAQANLAATCGKCHPGAGSRFPIGRVHIEAKLDSSPGVFTARLFYTIFISILVACFAVYIALDMRSRARARKEGP